MITLYSVIDYQEAKDIFGNVRQPQGAECILEQVLYQCVRSPTSEVLITDLSSLTSSDPAKNTQDNEEKHNENNSNTANSGETNGQTFAGDEPSFTKTEN